MPRRRGIDYDVTGAYGGAGVPKEVGRDAVARWDAQRRADLLAKTPLYGNLSSSALQDLAAAFLPRSAKRDTLPRAARNSVARRRSAAIQSRYYRDSDRGGSWG